MEQLRADVDMLHVSFDAQLLDEAEMTTTLIIAASDSTEGRLGQAEIDQLLGL